MRLLRAAGVAAAATALFFAYLYVSRTGTINADGSSNALQAWDMLHGNILLSGWTTTDVPFYTNELVIYMFVELIFGYHAAVLHIGSALIYTILVLLVAYVAKGRSTGRAGWTRMAIAVAIVAVPIPGFAAGVLLSSPNHTGSSIPLLLALLVLERTIERGWIKLATIALILALGQISDPLVLYIGAIPLILLSLVRMVRSRQWKGLDAALFIAAVSSIVMAQGALALIRAAGGFRANSAPAELSTLADLPAHVQLTAEGLSGIFGGIYPDRVGGWDTAFGALHLFGLIVVILSVCEVVVRAMRSRDGDRVLELATLIVVVNLGAYIASTLPIDLGTTRDITPVMFVGAVVAGRVWGERLAKVRARRVVPVLAAILLVLAAELGVHASKPSVPSDVQAAADWLEAQGLRYGIGNYWTSNNLTLTAGGRVEVAPLHAITVDGTQRIAGYRSESRADWYDPARRDVRFVVIDIAYPDHGTEAMATAQFGQPIARHQFGRAIVLVYDHNLLVGLPAFCIPGTAPSMAGCAPVDHSLLG